MITVLGASGFIGSHLVEKLGRLGIEHLSPRREDELPRRNLGDIIYCIGLTADFRAKPFETVNAHVCHLAEVLQGCEFDSLLYLSSARVYANNLGVAREEDSLQMTPLHASDLYNISKAMGESLSFASGKKTRVVRLSNVYGDDPDSLNFLSAVVKDAVTKKKVVLQTSAGSEKDYISIDDVVDGLIKIATKGNYNIYNLANGANVTNRQLLERIRDLTGCRIEIAPNAPKISFPVISIDRMCAEFDFRPSNVLDNLGELVEVYRNRTGG